MCIRDRPCRGRSASDRSTRYACSVIRKAMRDIYRAPTYQRKGERPRGARLVGSVGGSGPAPLAGRPAAAGTAAEEHRHADHEAEVVPATVVVHLVDAHRVGEQGDDERERADEAVPQPQPEPRYVTTGRGRVGHVVPTCGAGRQQEHRTDQQTDPQNPSAHDRPPPVPTQHPTARTAPGVQRLGEGSYGRSRTLMAVRRSIAAYPSGARSKGSDRSNTGDGSRAPTRISAISSGR